MEKRPAVISWIQFLLLSTVFLIPLFSLDFLAYSVIEKTLLFYFLVEVALCLWLYVLLKNKDYFPTWNLLLITPGVFLLSFTISGILSVSPELAFWSSMSRMTGLILLFHIAAFVLMLVSTVREDKTWTKLIGAMAISGALVSLPMYLSILSGEQMEAVKSTFGNDSYTAAFLTFSFFFSLLMVFKPMERKSKVFFAVCAAAIIFSPVFLTLQKSVEIFTDPTLILGTARAAAVSIFIGLTLSALAYVATSSRETLSRIGKGLFISTFAGLVVLSIMVFVPNSVVQQKFSEEGIGSRLVFWESAIAGFVDRPLLGYGPENYSVPFYLHFNSALLTQYYTYELYTSKPHSSYLEVLVSGGVLSFIPYMAIWIILFGYLWQLRQDGKLSRVETALFTGLVSAYLLQNIVLFDALSSYMGIGLVIAYVVYVSRIKNTIHTHPSLGRRFSWTYASPACATLVVLFFFFVWMPFSQQSKLIRLMEEVTVIERSSMYDELFTISPNMNVSMSEYLMGKVLKNIPSALSGMSTEQKEIVLKDISSLRQTIQTRIETVEVAHYRHVYYLARLQLLEFTLEQNKEKREGLLLSVQALEEILEKLSPKNPQNYWVKAQRELFSGETKLALTTLNSSLEQDPNVSNTVEMIIQVEESISTGKGTPFFIY